MNAIQGFILGLVQGLTEFLPVSSSGHLTIFQELFGVGGETNLAFDVVVHLATVLSTIVVFRKPLGRMICGFFSKGKNDEKSYVFKILVALIPVLIVGLALKDIVEKLFSTDHIAQSTGNGLLLVGLMLMLTALLLFVSELITGKRAAKEITQKQTDPVQPVSEDAVREDNKSISYMQAFIVGIAQAVAVLPGLSRSGSTIATGLLVKMKKSVVAQFSFLIVIIPVLGEVFLEVVKSVKDAAAVQGAEAGFFSGIGFWPLCLGFIAAFFSGVLACTWMVNLVKKVKLNGFAIYCVIVGLLCVVLPYIF